ncbi:MAG: hypothetical protein ACW991_08460 [Candidatus Hodarchaeales archaeon]|jgi:tRNA (guanine26-N2/guanine27-N2)-dimethyltransferase
MKLIEIREGLGTFLVPESNTVEHIPRRSDNVFFNFHQEINRDLSVLALRAFGNINLKSDLRVCEPLCGSGIRSARYAMETPTSSIYSNDINSDAINIAQKNIKRLPKASAKKIQLYNMECNFFLQTLNIRDIIFDFIDIDPFGTPIPFVHNSVHLITLNGLLAFTATDLASLVGLYPQALYAQYGVNLFNIWIGNIHEIASRALITGIQHVGLTLGQSLIPVVTFYHRHFVRCFFIRKRGVNGVLDQTGFINLCEKCKTRFISNLGEKTSSCSVCGASNGMNVGPLYLGKIQQLDYLASMLNDGHLEKMGTKKRLMKCLPLMIEETSIDIPWSFDIPKLAKKARVPVPPLTQVAKVLDEMGYQSCKTHYSGTSLKTDANETELCSIISSLKS